MPDRSHRANKGPEILPLIDATTLRKSRTSLESTRRSIETARASSESSRQSSDSSKPERNASHRKHRSASVRKVTYTDAKGQVVREVRLDRNGGVEMSPRSGSARPGSNSSASMSSGDSDALSEGGKRVEYAHQGTSRERVIRTTYTFPDGSLKILDYR
jgi:hypothetical protein